MPTEPVNRWKIACRTGTLRALCVLSFYAYGHINGLAQTGLSQLQAGSAASSTDYTASSPSSHTSRHADITYRGDLLTVDASNASLNQILREISRQTGMKISGGVAEDRVFGKYGPASPAAVLATLLDGTGSNLLIVQDASKLPTELILTPRVGRVSPPNPNAQISDDSDNSAEDALPPVQSPPPAPVLPPSSQPSNSRAPNRAGTGGIDTNPAATAPSSTTQQLAFPPIDATNPPATATTTPNTPDPTSDSVKTPQQIFEQLQRLRQQQTQQPPPK